MLRSAAPPRTADRPICTGRVVPVGCFEYSITRALSTGSRAAVLPLGFSSGCSQLCGCRGLPIACVAGLVEGAGAVNPVRRNGTERGWHKAGVHAEIEGIARVGSQSLCSGLRTRWRRACWRRRRSSSGGTRVRRLKLGRSQAGTGSGAAGQGDWNWPMQASCRGTRAALVRSGLLQLRRAEGVGSGCCGLRRR